MGMGNRGIRADWRQDAIFGVVIWFVVCLLISAGSEEALGFTPVSKNYAQNENIEHHWAEQVTVTANGAMVWVTAPTGWSDWGTSNVSLDNESGTTAAYFNLNSIISSYLSTSLGEADILRKGKALDFRFRLSTFGMRVATGDGSITVDVRGTR